MAQQQSAANVQNQLIKNNFGEAAQNYVTSTVHAEGPDLRWLIEDATLTGNEIVLDVATGTGHTALALAPHVREVIALDFTYPMLEAAQQLAHERQITNIRFVEGDAHAIPLADHSLDIVACRKAAHHFVDVPQALREWSRVLKPGGELIFVDTIAPEDPALDAFVNEVEVLRDPSHVRNHRISQWLEQLKAVGIAAKMTRTWGIHMDVPSWTKRIRTPEANVQRILQMFTDATPEQRACLNIEQHNGIFTFDIPSALMIGTKVR
jgi:Methylase involved in ubiquinone/menaquinone biosynthesis